MVKTIVNRNIRASAFFPPRGTLRANRFEAAGSLLPRIVAKRWRPRGRIGGRLGHCMRPVDENVVEQPAVIGNQRQQGQRDSISLAFGVLQVVVGWKSGIK